MRAKIIYRLQKVVSWYEDGHLNDLNKKHYQEVVDKVYALRLGLPFEIIDVTEQVIGGVAGQIATLQKNYGKMRHVVGH